MCVLALHDEAPLPAPLRRALLSSALAALLGRRSRLAAPDRTATLTSAAAELGWDGPRPPAAIDPSPATTRLEACTKDEAQLLRPDADQDRERRARHARRRHRRVTATRLRLRPFVYKSNASGTRHRRTTTSPTSRNPRRRPVHVPEHRPAERLRGVARRSRTSSPATAWSRRYYDVDDGTYKGTAKVTGATPGPRRRRPRRRRRARRRRRPRRRRRRPRAPALSTLPFKAATTIGSASKAKKKRSFSFTATADETISEPHRLAVQGQEGPRHASRSRRSPRARARSSSSCPRASRRSSRRAPTPSARAAP